MGRELQQVPANYEHPRYTADNAMHPNQIGQFKPLHCEPYESALAKFQATIDKDGLEEAIEYWGGAPEKSDYVSFKESEREWFQVWETVSEGTPVTPPFATKEELIDYLVGNGDFWDQNRRTQRPRLVSAMECQPWSREQAEHFVNGSGRAPSLVVIDGAVMSGVEAMVRLQKSP